MAYCIYISKSGESDQGCFLVYDIKSFHFNAVC